MEHPTLAMPHLLGIVNITTDSFSDGGQYLEPQSLEEHILKLCEDECPILDLGAASSNPAANPVDTELEIERLGVALGIVQ